MSIIFSEFLKFIESAVFVIILWQMLTFLFVIIELLLIFLFIFADTNYLSTLACGPYGLIFASFIPFFLDIPVTSRFRIFGVNFSDKSFIYLAGLQLLLSSGKRSLIPGICGLIAGSLYRLNVLGIRRMKVSSPLFILY
jgi:hypothetical protein